MPKSNYQKIVIDSLFDSYVSACPSNYIEPNRKLSVTTRNIAPRTPSEVQWMIDFPRKLAIPRPGPPNMVGMINREKMEKLRKAAHVVSKEERQAMIEKQLQAEEERKKLHDALRAECESWDTVRKQNEQLSEFEKGTKQKMEEVRKRAKDMALERNEEIKEINQLIMTAKVQAIRDAQVLEKQFIKHEKKKVELSLDEHMEKERVKALEIERQKVTEKKDKAYEAGAKLQQQIKSNRELQLLKQDLKTREGDEMLKRIEKDHEKDFMEQKVSKLKQKAFLDELLKENEALRKEKERLKQRSEEEDKRLAEYQKMKAAEADAKEAEIKEAKQRRDLKLTQLGELHKKGFDLKAQEEALKIRRAQEEKEREVRQREMEKVLKQKKIQESLNKSRAEQLEAQDRLKRELAEKNAKALEVQMQKMQQELIQEEHDLQMKRYQNLKYSAEIRSQMKQKEKERINEKKKFLEEGFHLEEENVKRNEMMEYVKKEKLKELDKYNLPETYITYIKRKVNLK